MQQIDTTALDALNTLQQPGKPSLLARIVDVYKVDAPVAIDNIIDAVAIDDFETVAQTAHSLKSSSAYLGANALAQRLIELEVAAKASDSAVCKKLCEELKDQSVSVLNELQMILEKAA